MWMEFECETSLLAKTRETRQRFVYFLGLEFPRLIESWNRKQAFSPFLEPWGVMESWSDGVME
jgi:hypothetical protein